MYCKNCGVELEEGMINCPLCGMPTDSKENFAGRLPQTYGIQQQFVSTSKMSRPQKKFTWEIVSIILLSGTIASFIVDFIINKDITWSEVTLAIGLTVFSYVSLFAFWDQPTILEMFGSLLLSSVFLIGLDAFTNGLSWSIRLAIPLLFAANLVVAILITIVRRSRFKGVNVIGYAFIGASVLCLFIEAITRFFQTGTINLRWSIIVGACVTPVVIVLFFLHYKLKKGRYLKKTFHV